MASYKSRVKRKIKRRVRKSPIVIAILIILAIIGVLLWQYGDKLGLDIFGQEESLTVPTPSDGEVLYHVIDVGQADAILISTRSGNMLIDSGDLSEESRDALVNYLKAANVTAFEYVVFTHTDADHIGSGDYIISNYDVKNVIMPNYEATTAVYARLVDAIAEKDVNLILIGEDKEICRQSGYKFYLGSVLNTVMAPTEDFSDPNEMSVVIKSVYGETSVLLTGDAEAGSEEAMLKKYKRGELDCDILKVGHHGSSTSTTKEFLQAVSPEAALISCGQNNKHGHPDSVTIDKLNDADIKIYRTDKQGSIVIKTDGTTYSITAEK